MLLVEHPIGCIIKYKGLRLHICEAVQACRGCYFRKDIRCPVETIGVCCQPWRHRNVIFRKVDINKKENNHGRSRKAAASKIKKSKGRYSANLDQ